MGSLGHESIRNGDFRKWRVYEMKRSADGRFKVICNTPYRVHFSVQKTHCRVQSASKTEIEKESK